MALEAVAVVPHPSASARRTLRTATPVEAPALPTLPAVPAPGPAPAALANPDPGDFGRYEVILSRMPFGDEAAALAAATAAKSAASAAAAESFAKNVKMCAITRNRFNNRVQVGLVDVASKKSYFLYEGDSEDGYELVKADYENEKAVVKKGDEEIEMTMSAVAAAAPVVTRGPGGVRVGPGAPPFEQPLDPTMVNRNLRVVDNTKNVPKLPPAELQKKLQDYQMELIRAKGERGPPLPMQLTPEMDSQLVKEGVLPPNE